MAGDDIMDEAKALLQGAASMQVVQQMVDAYDDFAIEAMKALLCEHPDESEEDIAGWAWSMADAMMKERAKRGLGSMPGSSA